MKYLSRHIFSLKQQLVRQNRLWRFDSDKCQWGRCMAHYQQFGPSAHAIFEQWKSGSDFPKEVLTFVGDFDLWPKMSRVKIDSAAILDHQPWSWCHPWLHPSQIKYIPNHIHPGSAIQPRSLTLDHRSRIAILDYSYLLHSNSAMNMLSLSLENHVRNTNVPPVDSDPNLKFKSLRDVPQMLVAYTCSGQKSKL